MLWIHGGALKSRASVRGIPGSTPEIEISRFHHSKGHDSGRTKGERGNLIIFFVMPPHNQPSKYSRNVYKIAYTGGFLPMFFFVLCHHTTSLQIFLHLNKCVCVCHSFHGPLRECLQARRFRATLLLHLYLCAFLM